jgi:hypothetical protein
MAMQMDVVIDPANSLTRLDCLVSFLTTAVSLATLDGFLRCA